jgi:hypothetical protein
MKKSAVFTAVATIALLGGLTHRAQGQASTSSYNYVTESQTATLAWSGNPVYQTGTTPESGSGGSTHDVSGWGSTPSGVNGDGSIGQVFEVTSAGTLTSAQVVMAGGTGGFYVELYSLGSAASVGFPPVYNSAGSGATTPPITQMNIGNNLLSSQDSFNTTAMAGEELITLTFGGSDASIMLVPGQVYMLALDPTANVSRSGTWWSRGGNPVAAYDTGEAMDTDSTSYAFAYQDLGGRTSIRDLDTAIDVIPEPSTIALGVIGASSLLLRRRK